MGELKSPHWEALLPRTQELLQTLSTLTVLRSFYLAGGTALALRLGHRISQDLDFFANIETLDDDLRRQIILTLQNHSPTIHQDSNLGLVLEVNYVVTSFFSYGYPLLAPTDSVLGIEVASLLDIGLMKLDAIAGRGMRKDFYDIYAIAQQIRLDDLFAHIETKYPNSRTFPMRALTALVDFDIAEQQEEPILLAPLVWSEVKRFCQAEARRLGRIWFAG
ncbi:MAG: nucleotidyl transferase AbiEii/AbiGii toxin family protein [Anaerolineae bacterium]|nr:nucleotidyl transferase AbiEii/AbiGii toxin family protein [Anaerolineae bacterium]